MCTLSPVPPCRCSINHCGPSHRPAKPGQKGKHRTQDCSFVLRWVKRRLESVLGDAQREPSRERAPGPSAPDGIPSVNVVKCVVHIWRKERKGRRGKKKRRRTENLCCPLWKKWASDIRWCLRHGSVYICLSICSCGRASWKVGQLPFLAELSQGIASATDAAECRC